MQPSELGGAEEAHALLLLRRLRQIDSKIGIGNSRIAFDLGVVFYELGRQEPSRQLTVDQMADIAGYSGPTIRLVFKRMMAQGHITAAERLGKTQLYAMTAKGRAAFRAYVQALLEFRRSDWPLA